MNQKSSLDTSPGRVASRGGVLNLALAAGGLFAAFGAASCCALPLFLAGIGVSSISLFGLAWLVGPYQRLLLLAASLCLVGVTVLAWRRRRARVCRPTPGRIGAAIDWISGGAALFALFLLALAVWGEPPL